MENTKKLLTGNAVIDYAKFKTIGINDSLTEEDIKALNRLDKYEARKSILEANRAETIPTYYGTRILRSIDVGYSVDDILKIFNNANKLGWNLSFRNSRDEKVLIEKATARKGTTDHNFILLHCHFENSSKIWVVRLGRFLQLIDYKEFKGVHPEIFKSRYLSSVENQINFLTNQINKIRTKYNDLFNEVQNNVLQAFNDEQSSHIGYESNYQPKEKSDAELVAQNKKAVGEVKNVFNSLLTWDERRKIIEWIANNIYSIRVYAIAGGRGNSRLNNYSAFGSQAIRQPQLDEEGRLIKGTDSANGHISFKNVDTAPCELLSKLCSGRRNAKSLFNKNRLNDFNLALFLLSEYHDYGFKSGVLNLNKEIDLKALLCNEFIII